MPKTVRPCEVGVRVCNNLPQPPISEGDVAEGSDTGGNLALYCEKSLEIKRNHEKSQLEIRNQKSHSRWARP